MEFLTDIENCLRVLQSGGLILYPTDTVWGIGCDATNEKAVLRIESLKKRSKEKSFIVLMVDQREVLRYVGAPDLRIFDFLQTVEKPTTVVYEGAVHLAASLLAEDGSVAIRLITEPFCKQLIKRFRKPIVSTSANLSGRPAPRFFDDISVEIMQGVDYVVKYRRDESTAGQPSAVVKLNRDGTVTTIRK